MALIVFVVIFVLLFVGFAIAQGLGSPSVPSGAVAGIFARTDASRGVWKAPAGLDATLIGVPQLSVPLNDADNGELNPLGINCLRSLPVFGNVVHPGIGSLLTPTSPLHFADVFNDAPGAAPLLGTHTDEVLEEVLGLSPTEVGRLHDDGLVASA